VPNIDNFVHAFESFSYFGFETPSLIEANHVEGNWMVKGERTGRVDKCLVYVGFI